MGAAPMVPAKIAGELVGEAMEHGRQLGRAEAAAAHDARVTELLEACNAEVERRRVAEAELRWLRLLRAAVVDPTAHDAGLVPLRLRCLAQRRPAVAT